MQRRTLLRVGLAAGVVLAGAAGTIALVRPARQAGQLTESGSQIQRLEQTIAGMPAALQREVDELLTIAASAPGRLALVGLTKPWAEASDADIVAALTTMNQSSLALRQQAFQALRELTLAAWLAEPGHWQAIGYTGQYPVPNVIPSA